jgi:putative endonuclease
MFYVYILYSRQLDMYYTGETDDVIARMKKHLAGKSPFTSRVSDWIKVYTEEFEERRFAVKREREIKKKKRRSYIEYLITREYGRLF